VLRYTYIACLVRLCCSFLFVICMFFLCFCAVCNLHCGCLARTLKERFELYVELVFLWRYRWLGYGLDDRRIGTRLPIFSIACAQMESGVYPILGAFAELRKATVSFVMSAHPSAFNKSAPTGGIFMTLMYEYFSKNCRENSSCISI